jgi:Ran GTPase-activating protein (RanGAP) involved in mRNA processing and transport
MGCTSSTPRKSNTNNTGGASGGATTTKAGNDIEAPNTISTTSHTTNPTTTTTNTNPTTTTPPPPTTTATAATTTTTSAPPPAAAAATTTTAATTATTTTTTVPPPPPTQPLTTTTSSPPTTTSTTKKATSSLTELLFPTRAPPNEELNRAVEEIKRGSRNDLDLRYVNVGDAHVKSIIVPLLEDSPQLVKKIVIRQFETNKQEEKVSLHGISMLMSSLQSPRIVVKELDLSGCQLGDAGCLQVAECLSKHYNRSIEILCLLSNEITDIGASALAEVLVNRAPGETEICSKIWNLSLHNNKITSVGAKKIADALRVNRNITKLHLFGNLINLEGIQAFATYLKEDKGASLKELDLGQNAFADQDVDAARALGVALKNNTTLTMLDLSMNELSAVAIGFLADGVRHSNTLQTLGMVKCGVDDEAMDYLADALSTNTTLQSLSLSDNVIGDEGATRLASALEVNLGLDHLSLSRNRKITAAGRRTLVKAFVVSSAPLKKFALDDMSFSGIDLSQLMPSKRPQAWPARLQQLPTGWIFFDSLRNWTRAHERGDRVYFVIPPQIVRKGPAYADAYYETARQMLPFMMRVKGFPEDLCQEIFLILMEDRLSPQADGGGGAGAGGGAGGGAGQGQNLAAMVEAWEGE